MTAKVDFGAHLYTGQLHAAERKLLYDTVSEIKPKKIIELGTWKGMGSTYFMARAILDNKIDGTIHTYEINEQFQKEAISNLHNAGVDQIIKFHLGDFLTKFNETNIDLAFLDGPENSAYTLQAFNLVSKVIKDNGVIVFHDWKIEKCREMREYLRNNHIWVIDTFIDSEVGICKIQKH